MFPTSDAQHTTMWPTRENLKEAHRCDMKGPRSRLVSKSTRLLTLARLRALNSKRFSCTTRTAGASCRLQSRLVVGSKQRQQGKVQLPVRWRSCMCWSKESLGCTAGASVQAQLSAQVWQSQGRFRTPDGVE